MGNEHILIVDDEDSILELIDYNLKREGYKTSMLKSGESVLTETLKKIPDLIVLDLMLPGIDGLEVCRQLKHNDKTKDIPIVMVTAKSEDTDIVLGLEMGADDYLTKPFSPKVLIARVRAALRRNKKSYSLNAPDILKIHGISMDIKKHEIICGEENVILSMTEFGILEFLVRNPGWVFSRNQIIEAVKGSDYPVTERAVDVQILGLRKKLKDQGKFIETIRGIGYRMREQKDEK